MTEPTAANNYQVGPTLAFSRDLWNAVMLSIAQRIGAREALEATFEALVADGTQAALDLIQVNVGPQLAALTAQIAALEEQLEEILGSGTAANSLLLGNQLPAFYLALANATGLLPVAQVSGIEALIQSYIDALKGGVGTALDTLDELAAALGDDANFAATMTTQLAARMQKAQNLADLTDKAVARTNLQIDRFNRPRNRFVNPSMRVSQERGTALVDVSNGAPYVVDQWRAIALSSPGGTMRVQQVASVTPGGSSSRLRATVQSTDVSIAAGDLYQIDQTIEGINVDDAVFGSASAKNLLLRLGVRSSVAGTFSVSYRNSDASRSWLGFIAIAPGEVNADLVKTLTIPGDTTGTWLRDTSLGGYLGVTLACGSTSQGVAGWQASSKLALATQSNFMATGGATFELFDAGLYVDHDGTGIMPPWTLPDLADELIACQRYYEKVGFIVSTQSAFLSCPFVEKRAVPSISATFDTGSGATFIPVSSQPTRAFYCNSNHSSPATALVTISARL